MKLQTLAEKCLIPIYKLPKFAAELLDNNPEIYIHLLPSINLMYEKKKKKKKKKKKLFKIYIMN